MNAEDTPMPSWVAGRHSPSPDAELRLLCFPHAGGGSAVFRPWRQAFGPRVEVWPILLPGRESRFHEPRVRRVEQLLDPLVDALSGHLDRPYALFGHSLGAVIAYEFARRAGSRIGEPVHLFVSGRRAPHLPARHEPVHALPDEEFLLSVRALNGTPEEVFVDKDIMDLFLPTLRTDFELNETYEPLPGPRLSCRMSAIMGVSDPEVNQAELAAWSRLTSGAFTTQVFPGDHFYLQPPGDDLLGLVSRGLRPWATDPQLANMGPPSHVE